MVQNQIIHLGPVFLAAVWPSWTEPAQPEIDTWAILSRNGKPELSSEPSIQKATEVEV